MAAVGSNTLTYQTYSDSDFGFTLQYPVGYQIETKHKQPQSVIDDEAILKRVIFSSFPALVYLDIWLTKGKSLSDWLTWYKETRQVDQMPTEANSTVATKSAATFLQEQQRDLMITYFTDGKYVYRLLNWMTNNPTHLDAYWHMLNTFTLPEMTSLVTAEIPILTRQESIRATERSMGMSLVNNCCGHNDPGDPFPCCGCDECCGCEQEGNCTWWVFYKMAYVPFTGNAGTWWNQAGNYTEWDRGSLPHTDGRPSIANWSGSPGHVAYVANYSGSGDVTKSDMSWCDHCDQTNTMDPYTPRGYIYENFQQ